MFPWNDETGPRDVGVGGSADFGGKGGKAGVAGGSDAASSVSPFKTVIAIGGGGALYVVGDLK
jgi:hypothetical protein